MDFTGFSLLYPASLKSGAATPHISPEVLGELGFLEVFDMDGNELSELFTADPEVIRYREETFSDMMQYPSLSTMMEKLVPVLSDILELRRLSADFANDTESYLSSITEIELYTSCVDILHAGLCETRGQLKSKAFLALYDLITELTESDYYKLLNQKLTELTERVREIRSVTIGVNLDAQLRPRDAGVLSINSAPFKSGDVIDKILRLDFKNDAYTCIANLVPFGKKQSDNQKAALSIAFNSAINDVYRSSLHSWKKIVQMYVLENTDFLLNLLPEFRLLTRGTRLMKDLLARGCNLCEPEIFPADKVTFSMTGLYNPCVALQISEPIVTNDMFFDDRARVYILSGPNRGGKSVITCAVGLAAVMIQLGMFAPAEKAAYSPADAVYTHFPTGAEDTLEKGRLGEECARLGEIFDKVTGKSIVLLDESLSSTGSYEASYIAAEVVAGLAKVGCRSLFSTHLHELTARLDDESYKERIKDAYPVDTLVAGMEEGQRSFRIYRKRPDGKSYARDIADKYGLSFERITEKIKKRG